MRVEKWELSENVSERAKYGKIDNKNDPLLEKRNGEEGRRAKKKSSSSFLFCWSLKEQRRTFLRLKIHPPLQAFFFPSRSRETFMVGALLHHYLSSTLIPRWKSLLCSHFSLLLHQLQMRSQLPPEDSELQDQGMLRNFHASDGGIFTLLLCMWIKAPRADGCVIIISFSTSIIMGSNTIFLYVLIQ